jgi:alpha-methylacyl-CoA racemase
MGGEPDPRTGPLAGVRVVELGGIGPGPYAGMLLADLGASVVRVDRPGEDLRATHSVLLRGRRSVVLDLKSDLGREAVLRLAERSDVLLEGFRPGVAERLGLGPDEALARNPRLVYGRMTGWGQDGPYAELAGHDITYLAVTGVLEAFVGADGRPVPPLNLLGDFGTGGMLLALGVVSAVLHAGSTGEGQVVDAAIVDGVASTTAMLQSMLASGSWGAPRGANLFDGGAPFYRCYRTSDDRWMAVGAIEPLFYARLLDGLGLTPGDVGAEQLDASAWPRIS